MYVMVLTEYNFIIYRYVKTIVEILEHLVTRHHRDMNDSLQ